MRCLGVLFASLLVTIALQAQSSARGNPSVAFEGQSVDEMIAAFMRDNDVSGLSMAIVQAPYITRATGFGVADRRNGTLVSVNTMFNIAQMRNAFTALAAMQLVEAGKLDLQAVLPLIRNPAEYARLETLIESASGESYREFVRKNQFDRIGLRHTFFSSELSAAPQEGVTSGQQHRRFLKEPALIDPTEPAAADGGAEVNVQPNAIYSSASDISVWDIALAGEILVKDPALRKVLYQPPAPNVPTSGPWFFPGHPGLMIATGSGEGSSSLLSRFTNRDELVCVTLLANREGLDLTQLARRIAGAFNPKIGPPRKAANLRVQQSPYDATETTARLERALRSRGLAVGRATVWQDNGETWLAAPDPAGADSRGDRSSALRARRNLDDALLHAIY